MGWRFNPAPGWPPAPEGFIPAPGWTPDPTWPPAPPGWPFWVDEVTGEPAPAAGPPAGQASPATAAEPPTSLDGDDGCLELTGDRLVLTFADKRLGNPLKKAVGVRVYPLAAVADLRIDPSGHRGHPTLTVVVRPECDLLRPLLKNPQPGPEADPDVLILPKGGTVRAAEAFAANVRAQLPAEPATGAFVDSGELPLTAKGASTRAVFDGATVTFEVSSWTATGVKNVYPRRIPAEAVADVVLEHPGLTGKLRFVLAGGPGRDALANPKTDLDTVELAADNGQAYAVLVAAVLTAARRTGVREHPELLPTYVTAAVPPAPSAAASPDTTATPKRVTPADPPALPAPVPPMPVATKPTWRERRAEKRAVKEHEQTVAQWQAEQNLLDRVAAAARAAANGGGAAAGIVLKAGEAALWSSGASLVEPRRQPGHYQGGYSGVSFRIAKGVRYSVGGTRGRYVPGPEVQTPVDAGRVVVTTQRVLFIGSRTTREWSFAKLVSIDSSSDDSVVLIHVSNRQNVSGVLVGKVGAEFTTFLALGVAIAQNGAPAVAEECEQTAATHRNSRP